MIAEEHAYDDPVKAADLRHRPSIGPDDDGFRAAQGFEASDFDDRSFVILACRKRTLYARSLLNPMVSYTPSTVVSYRRAIPQNAVHLADASSLNELVASGRLWCALNRFSGSILSLTCCSCRKLLPYAAVAVTSESSEASLMLRVARSAAPLRVGVDERK
jgi:hypothetical protein